MNKRKQDTINMFENSKLANMYSLTKISLNKILNEFFFIQRKVQLTSTM